MRHVCVLLCLLLPLATLAAAPAAADSGSPSSLEEMKSYLAKAQDAADSNHLSEAIRSYVTVLVLADESPSPEAKANADRASAELSRIGTRLTLEPSGEWVDPKGAQIAGTSRGLGKEGGLSPAVYLFENFGSGKSPVADAPIFFQFVKNSGSLVAFVTTDAYGKANTTVAKLDEPGSDVVIRAFPVFKARGKSYAFQSVFRDFAYLPPVNVVKVLALESSELGVSDSPRTVDPAAAALKQAGLQVLPFNAKLIPDDFRAAYGGNVKALAALGVDAASPYAAFVLVDVAAARQLELNGKTYNIFTAVAVLNFRLVRSDGSIVFSLSSDGIKGQGNAKEAAVSDAYKRAGESIARALQNKLDDLRAALTKE
ncbi:MAG: hypothetical protein ABSF43_00025 [Rectinemataceae bacterium]